MPELGAFESARGVPGNGHSYRKPRPFRSLGVIEWAGRPRMSKIDPQSSFPIGTGNVRLLDRTSVDGQDETYWSRTARGGGDRGVPYKGSIPLSPPNFGKLSFTIVQSARES